MINTIETRLNLDNQSELTSLIDSSIITWSQYFHKTWALLNRLQKNEQDIYHILIKTNDLTSYQIKSLINKVQTEHAKIKELTKTQLKQKQSKLSYIEEFIKKEQKLINQNKNKIITLKQLLSKFKLKNNISKDKLNDTYSKINQLTLSNKKKEFTVEQKIIKVNYLNKSIKLLENRIKNNNFKLCFGSSELLKQYPKHSSNKHRLNQNQQVYKNNEKDIKLWTEDWNLSRYNQLFSVGSKEKPQGNGEIQYYHETKILRIRLVEKVYLERLQKISQELNIPFEDLNNHQFTKYGIYRKEARFIEINNVEFTLKNQLKIIQAISNNQPITAKLIKRKTSNGKTIGYYVQLSFDEQTIPLVQLSKKPLTIGIDLNDKGLAYCIVKPDGNKLNKNINIKNNTNTIKNEIVKSHGFIKWDLLDKTTEQREWIISNTITELLNIAQSYGVYSVAIENLDFSSTMNKMNKGYKSNKKYNKMLTQFAKTKFKDYLQRKCLRLGITVNLVNPTYSSIGGYAKYGLINKLGIDISASLWLARQSIFGQEFKKEDNVISKKRHQELSALPYESQWKQSKKLKFIDKEWKHIGSQLGTDRRLWYINLMNLIKSESNVVKRAELEKDNLINNLLENPF